MASPSDPQTRARKLLGVACAVGNTRLVDALLVDTHHHHLHLDLFSPDEFGWSPIYIASRRGNTAVVQRLIAAGADIAVPDKDNRTPLYAAILGGGHIDTVRVLLDHGADPSVANRFGVTPLNLSAMESRPELAELFVQLGVAIDERDEKGWTALSSAAHAGSHEIVNLLLAHGADITTRTDEDSLPLGLAAMAGHLDIVKTLLDHGADITAKDDFDRTPLFLACVSRHIEVVRHLILKGADVTTPGKDNTTSLTVAARHGDIDIVRLLLDNGADAAAIQNDDWTALGLAAFEGHVETCQVLLDAGADMTYNTARVWPAFVIAADHGHVDVVRLLLERGAEIDTCPAAEGVLKWTALGYAACHGYVALARLLLDAGANVNYRDAEGLTPLYVASWKGQEEVMRILIAAGADLSIPDHVGVTPLQTAIFHRHPTAAMLLLESGPQAFIDTVDDSGYTPLLTAAQRGEANIVSILLHRGAQILQQDTEGWSALHHASADGHIEVVRRLLSHRAAIETLNSSAMTALGLASNRGHADVVALLLEHGADPRVKNRRQETPLHHAVKMGKPEAVKVLLKANSDISTIDADRRSLLVSACMNGHLEVAQVLLEAAAEELPCRDQDGVSVVFAASLSGNVELVRFLLSQGFSLSQPTQNGWIAIGAASEAGHADVIRVLLEHGATMSPNGAGFFPVHTAAFCGHIEALKVLAEYGADLSQTAGENNLTPLSLAMAEGWVEVVEFLLKEGVGITPEDGTGATELHMAAFRGQITMTKVFLNCGRQFDLCLKDSKGQTPLHLASEGGHVEVAEQLLAHGASCSAVNNLGQTPLFRAEGVEMAMLLLDHGADVNATSNDGFYPIHGAVIRGDIEITEFFLDRGAYLSVANDSGATPLILAMSGGFEELVEMLVEKYSDPDIAERDGRLAVDASNMSSYVMLARQNAVTRGRTDFDGHDAATPGSNPAETQLILPDNPLLLEANAEVERPETPVQDVILPPLSLFHDSLAEDVDQQVITSARAPSLFRPASDVCGTLCTTCKGIFENKTGQLPFDIWYTMNVVINKDPGKQQGLSPPNSKAPGFLHHWFARDMQAAAANGCYICERAWAKIKPEYQAELLRREVTDEVAVEDRVPFTYGMLFDTQYVTKLLSNPQPDHDTNQRFDQKGSIWSIAFNQDVMKLIKITPVDMPMFALASDKDVVQFDVDNVSSSTRTGSEESLSFALNQFTTCIEEHEECRSRMQAPWLPSRLIDLGDADGDACNVRLVLSENIERPNSYCTLSHCWGTTQVVKLTKAALGCFLAGLPMAELPKTFRDTFQVVRRLGVRYVWIDSLCIVQDDPEDWLNEASQMHMVYSNSLCNICATGASDSSKGLFVERDPGAFRTCDVSIPWLDDNGGFRVVDMMMWRAEVLVAPLHMRAWVVQEHLLSPRQLHFGATQILWECLRVTTAEQFPRGLPKAIPNLSHSSRRQLHQVAGNSSSDPGPSSAAGEHKKLLLGWSHIVQSYMKAKLSHGSDKVIAFSGLARRFEQILGDQCVAGLWKNNIENGLLWHVDYCRQGDGSPSFRPTEYRSPSFSWMSMEATVHLGDDNHDKRDAGILIDVLSVNISESRGVIKPGASIRIECTIKPIRIRRHVSSSGVMWLARFRHGKPQLGWSMSILCTVLMDEDKDYGDDMYYCVPVRGGPDDPFMMGLILELTGREAGEFRRIGYFQAGGEEKQLLKLPYWDESGFPCEKYTYWSKRHMISIV